jgi:hypothetical protein
MALNARFPRRPDPNDGVDQALADVLKAMTPGQLVEMAAAARLLSAAADQALARRDP